MKVFVYSIIKFLLYLVATAILFISVELFVIKQHGIVLPKSKNILVLGDSHTECAIDDIVLPRAANFSESGSTYYYSLIKLKEILKTNKQIDTLILSFHFGSLDIDNEKEFLFNESYNFERLPKFIPFMDKTDFLNYYDKVILVKSILNSPAHYFPFIFSGIFSGNYKTEKMKLGAFSASNRNKLNEDIEIRNKKKGIKLKNDFSAIEFRLMTEIKEVCNKNNVCLILINTPIYHANLFTDTSFYYRFRSENSSKFNFLDLHQFNPGQEGFGDISHLNKTGALLFSKELNRIFSLNSSHNF